MDQHDNQRMSRLEAETSRLLGVDFLPRRNGTFRPPPAGASPPLIESLPVTLPSPAPVPAPPDSSAERKRAALDGLRQHHDQACPICRAMPGITQTVFGEGSPLALLMFVGEAPGEEEDRTGRPFVGKAGRKLDDIIAAMGLKREEVYIGNVLKSRPPGNRTPLPDEALGCGAFLRQQIEIIRPRVIVALGGPAMKFLLHASEGITRMRGRWASYDDGSLSIDVMPTFHPAYLLRNYTRETREQIWSDMQAVLQRLRGH